MIVAALVLMTLIATVGWTVAYLFYQDRVLFLHAYMKAQDGWNRANVTLEEVGTRIAALTEELDEISGTHAAVNITPQVH